MYRIVLTVFLLSLFVIAGCTEQQVAPADDKGNISLVMNKASSPQDISSIAVELLREGFEPVTKNISYNNYTGEYEIKNLEAGKWQIKIRAVDENNSVLFAEYF